MTTKRQLILTSEGLSMKADGAIVFQFRWADVSRIETYKWDLFATDLICLGFTVDSKQVTYEVDEEMSGFSELRDSMRSHFPSIPEDWWGVVAQPPFATNLRLLYERTAA